MDYIIEEDVDFFLKKNVQLLCRNCRSYFNPIENIGTWKCRMHTGEACGNYWTCCESLLMSRGCTIADHIAMGDNPHMTIHCSIDSFKKLPVRNIESVLNINETDVFISRIKRKK